MNVTPDDGFEEAGKCRAVSLITYFLSRGAKSFNETMANAARYGYLDIVKLMLELGATVYNEGIIAGVEGRHYKISAFLNIYADTH